jgi:hypothetical protein
MPNPIFMMDTEYIREHSKSRVFQQPPVRETTCTGIPQPVIDFYENILGKIEGVITYQSMRETYVKIHKKLLSRTNLRNRFVEPLESVGWLNREQDPYDKRGYIFEKCRIEPEPTKNMGEYDASYFKEIFPKDQPKEYLRELEIIWNKDKCNTEVDSGNGGCNTDNCDSDSDYP